MSLLFLSFNATATFILKFFPVYLARLHFTVSSVSGFSSNMQSWCICLWNLCIFPILWWWIHFPSPLIKNTSLSITYAISPILCAKVSMGKILNPKLPQTAVISVWLMYNKVLHVDALYECVCELVNRKNCKTLWVVFKTEQDHLPLSLSVCVRFLWWRPIVSFYSSKCYVLV